ncbi:TSPAN13 [Bugula neritina]|uniref:TSPAN13 n=1 Tax=Bugula neritina TaxID=10212 RepID=A0A7J7JZG8_BUGNE|nr:TSPAN13 [Bugula neritina]
MPRKVYSIDHKLSSSHKINKAKMGCGYFTCSRNALMALNILYVMIAVLLIGVAAYAKAISFIDSLAIIGAVIGCGAFLLLLACMGIFGAAKHHQICLFFYMVILFLLFLIQFSLAVALLALNKDTQDTLIEKAWEAENITLSKDVNCCSLHAWKKGDKTCSSSLRCCEGQNANSLCCGGKADVPCPCESCKKKLSPLVEMACKITGGVSLFISITEVRQLCSCKALVILPNFVLLLKLEYFCLHVQSSIAFHFANKMPFNLIYPLTFKI